MLSTIGWFSFYVTQFENGYTEQQRIFFLLAVISINCEWMPLQLHLRKAYYFSTCQLSQTVHIVLIRSKNATCKHSQTQEAK